jgi:hypothetical protein
MAAGSSRGNHWSFGVVIECAGRLNRHEAQFQVNQDTPAPRRPGLAKCDVLARLELNSNSHTPVAHAMRSGGISKERKLMKATLSVIAFGSQVRHTDSDHSDPQTKCNCDFLTRADRRLLLGASLRLLAVKFSHGRPILQNDVLRLAPLADDGATGPKR